jgi:hypothetical protein
MAKANPLLSMSLEEAQNALGITFTKAQRDAFEDNVRKASMDLAKKASLEAIDAKVADDTNSEEFYEYLVGIAEVFNQHVVKTNERGQGRGQIKEKVLTVSTEFGNLKISLTETV